MIEACIGIIFAGTKNGFSAWIWIFCCWIVCVVCCFQFWALDLYVFLVVFKTAFYTIVAREVCILIIFCNYIIIVLKVNICTLSNCILCRYDSYSCTYPNISLLCFYPPSTVSLHLSPDGGFCQLQIPVLSEDWWHACRWPLSQGSGSQQQWHPQTVEDEQLPSCFPCRYWEEAQTIDIMDFKY